MLAGELALITAALFTGAALYVSAAEQPSRLELDDNSMLRQWKLSYARGFAMQASLALASALFGLLAMWWTRDWRWLVGRADFCQLVVHADCHPSRQQAPRGHAP